MIYGHSDGVGYLMAAIGKARLGGKMEVARPMARSADGLFTALFNAAVYFNS